MKYRTDFVTKKAESLALTLQLLSLFSAPPARRYSVGIVVFFLPRFPGELLRRSAAISLPRPWRGGIVLGVKNKNFFDKKVVDFLFLRVYYTEYKD